jgi:hypothetical protein
MIPKPVPLSQALTAKQTVRVSGPPRTPVQTAIAVVCLVLVLWLAYRIGVVILRIVAGLLFMGLIAYGLWFLFIK